MDWADLPELEKDLSLTEKRLRQARHFRDLYLRQYHTFVGIVKVLEERTERLTEQYQRARWALIAGEQDDE